MLSVPSETELLALAVALGARGVAGWSRRESAAVRDLPAAPAALVRTARTTIRQGRDPLGEAFTGLRAPELRRRLGATYTPAPLIAAMVGWARRGPAPVRVVDPGCGSGRFLVAAGRAFPFAHLVGIDVDPMAATLTRAHLAAAGMASRAEVRLGSFCRMCLPPADGRTLYVGNPPYVRHHLISPAGKRWLLEAAARLGLRSSGLAGLHVHFFAAIAARARTGDAGILVTAAEWLDVNYGALVRQLLVERLGLTELHLLDPATHPFPDAATTAVITCFEPGTSARTVTVRRVGSIADLRARRGGRAVARERLAAARRWTPLTRPPRARPSGWVELGELCAVHRGQVTGANHIWIEGPHAAELPARVLFPCITRARELFASSPVLGAAAGLRRVIDLPADLSELDDDDERAAVERFLRLAHRLGAAQVFVARHRTPWWRVRLPTPAPILATYMARRPPAFVLNRAGVRHLNIAHGIYPRQALGPEALAELRAALERAARTEDGRIYAGGLAKFEPSEMERLLVPAPE